MRCQALPSRIRVPVASVPALVRPRIAPPVATGMKAGVSTGPWPVVSRPRRAARSSAGSRSSIEARIEAQIKAQHAGISRPSAPATPWASWEPVRSKPSPCSPASAFLHEDSDPGRFQHSDIVQLSPMAMVADSGTPASPRPVRARGACSPAPPAHRGDRDRWPRTRCDRDSPSRPASRGARPRGPAPGGASGEHHMEGVLDERRSHLEERPRPHRREVARHPFRGGIAGADAHAAAAVADEHREPRPEGDARRLPRRGARQRDFAEGAAAPPDEGAAVPDAKHPRAAARRSAPRVRRTGAPRSPRGGRRPGGRGRAPPDCGPRSVSSSPAGCRRDPPPPAGSGPRRPPDPFPLRSRSVRGRHAVPDPDPPDPVAGLEPVETSKPLLTCPNIV